MNGYFSLFFTRSKLLFQYRRAAAAAILTRIFWGIIKLWILQAFYSFSQSPQPITLSQAATFIWLGQALIQMLPWNFDKELERQIRDGSIAYELLRPLHLYGLIYSRVLALRFAPTLLGLIPVLLTGWLFFDLGPPASPEAFAAFIFSTLLGCLLAASITALVQITLFWTLSGEGIQRLIPHTTVLLSGMIVPLPLFPDFIQPFILLQPFRGIIDIPARLYTGVIPLTDLPQALLFQIIWCLILTLCGQYLVRKATSQIVLEGG